MASGPGAVEVEPLSSIPPNIVGPILQSGVQQQQTARQLDGEREQQEGLSARAARRSGMAADAVSESEADMPVGTDSEGGGSQGRESAGSEAENQSDAALDPDTGIRRDDDGQLHLDIEA